MLDWSQPYSREYGIFNMYNLSTDPATKEIDLMHLFALAAKAASIDSPTYHYTLFMSKDEQDKWFIPMEAELSTLLEKNTFTIIDRYAVPTVLGEGQCHAHIVKSTWVLTCKHRPDGIITKFKACFCVNVGQTA
jgi:hypothetical protein